MICPKCHWGLLGDEAVCPRCGTAVRTPPRPAEPPAARRWWWRYLTGWRLAAAAGALAAVGGLLVLAFALNGGRRPGAMGGPPAGTAPIRIGAGYGCPIDAPIRAFRSDGRYYWPNAPTQPGTDRRPTACYAKGFQARDAGYSEGLLPEGSERVSGVYLVPVHLGGQCQAAADALGFAVPCPTLLPNPPTGEPDPRCGSPSPFPATDPPCVVGGEAFLLTELRFAIPPAYAQAGLEQPEGDVFIAAIRQSAAATDAGSTVTSCPHPIDKGATPITFDGGTHGVGERIFCPLTEPVPVAGYLMVRWSLGDVTYQAAIAGDAGQHRRVVDEIIAAIRLVEPA